MQEAIDFSKQYLENLLTFFGLNISVEGSSDEDVIELSIPSTNMNGFLIGEHGGNLRAIQHIVSIALKNSGHPSRVNIDVADYKKQRASRLSEQVKIWMEAVKKTKNPMELGSMNAADRRIVHKTVAEVSGFETESVGEGRDRHVIIRLAE